MLRATIRCPERSYQPPDLTAGGQGPGGRARTVPPTPPKVKSGDREQTLSPAGRAAPSCGHQGAAQPAGPGRGQRCSASCQRRPHQANLSAQRRPATEVRQTPRKRIKNDFPHLEPSYLPFLSYSVGSLNEQKAEHRQVGERREILHTSTRPRTNANIIKQTTHSTFGSSAQLGMTLRLAAVTRPVTAVPRESTRPAWHTAAFAAAVLTFFSRWAPIKGKWSYQLNLTCNHKISCAKKKSGRWEYPLKNNHG